MKYLLQVCLVVCWFEVFGTFLSFNSKHYYASVVQTGSFVSIDVFVSKRLLHMVMWWKDVMLCQVLLTTHKPNRETVNPSHESLKSHIVWDMSGSVLGDM